jgi:pSer/pThr/pTyr-binding forkhead associated (FHA) protein
MNPPRTADPDPEHTVTGRIDHPVEEPTRPVRDEPTDGAVSAPFEPAAEDIAAPATLVVVRGRNAGSRFPVAATDVSIGRHRDCDIVLDDITVSRNHAELHDNGRHYTIADAGSLNGTYVNQTSVEGPIELADGDEIRIGTFRLRFVLGTH